MSTIYSLPCFFSDYNYIMKTFSCLICTWFEYLNTNSIDTINCIQTPMKMFFYHLHQDNLVKVCIFYPHLSLETVFLPLKLTQIFCINMNIYFLENWQFNHKSVPHLLHTYQAWKTVLKIWQNLKVCGIQKFKFSNSLVNWEKFGSTA